MVDTKPKISVVTCTYGQEQYIEETLRGVLMQQYDGPVEYIIANDNSPDNTDAVIKKYFEEHQVPHNFVIKYTRHEINKGMMSNFLWGLKQATGDYIALCEGDDYWTNPLKLQKQADFLKINHDYVLVSHKRIIVDQKSQIIKDTAVPTDDLFTQCLLFRNVIKEEFYIFDSSQITNADTFLILYLENFGKAKLLDFIGAAYRISASGIWSMVSSTVRYEKATNSYKSMLNFFQINHYTASIKVVHRHLLFREINRYLARPSKSATETVALVIKAIWKKELNAIKTLIYHYIKN